MDQWKYYEYLFIMIVDFIAVTLYQNEPKNIFLKAGIKLFGLDPVKPRVRSCDNINLVM